MTKEQAHLKTWTPDFINEKGEEFYESGRASIILFEHSQLNKNVKECSVCWGGGEIDINDDMETIKCTNCNGTGVVINK